MCESRHKGARIQVVYLLLEQTDRNHLLIHVKQLLCSRFGIGLGPIRGSCHLETPDIRANTSNITAKSLSAIPIPRAAVKNSFTTAVVGKGTSSSLPISNARSMSFCIMFTLNQASSGIFSTKGPRY